VRPVRTPTGALADVESRPLSIQVLHVRGCPNLDEIRRRVDHSIDKLGVTAVINELEGSYPSPTLVVGGVDVTGRLLGSDPSCRLDLPTEEQILTAIGRAAGVSIGHEATSALGTGDNGMNHTQTEQREDRPDRIRRDA